MAWCCHKSASLLCIGQSAVDGYASSLKKLQHVQTKLVFLRSKEIYSKLYLCFEIIWPGANELNYISVHCMGSLGEYGLLWKCGGYIRGATRGVTVSTSAFLACHQCYCAGSSLAWGLNLRSVVCGIFWSSSPGVFSGYSGFLPSFIGLMIQPTK